MGETDTGVTGGAFYYCSTGLDKAFFFGIFDDVEGCSVCVV